jgi:hypothetical protein
MEREEFEKQRAKPEIIDVSIDQPWWVSWSLDNEPCHRSVVNPFEFMDTLKATEPPGETENVKMQYFRAPDRSLGLTITARRQPGVNAAPPVQPSA